MPEHEPTIFERIGLPPEIIRDQPLETVHIRLGEIVPTRDGKHTKPQALDYFKLVKVSAGGDDLGDLPHFKGKKVTQLPVRLCSNAIEDNFKAGISAWDGLTGPFCYNRKGGNVAMRRDKAGNFNPCPCDRTKCPLWLNRKGDSVTVKQQLERGDAQRRIPPGEFASEYPWAKITRDLKCSPEMYLFCEIDGVTLPGEVARLYTASENSIRQVLSSLARVASRTGGIIAGIPLFLTIAMRRSKMSKDQKVPTIGFTLRTADDAEIRELVMNTVRVRELSGVGASETRALLARTTIGEMTGIDAQYIASHHLTGEQREAAFEDSDPDKPLDAEAVILDLDAAEEQVAEGWVNVCEDPIVDELCTRLGFNQARRDSIAMQSRGDVQKAQEFLRKYAAQQKVDVEDLFKPKGEESEPEADVQDAEFTEVPEQPADAPEDPVEAESTPEAADTPEEPEETADGAENASDGQDCPPPVNSDGSLFTPPAEDPEPEPDPEPPADLPDPNEPVPASAKAMAKMRIANAKAAGEEPAQRDLILADAPLKKSTPPAEEPKPEAAPEPEPEPPADDEPYDVGDLGPPLDMTSNLLDGGSTGGNFNF